MSADLAAELAADGAWLRTLAAALTRDPGRAEEAAQITWLQSWRERRGGRAPSRPWLRAALVNTLRREFRDDARRDVRQVRAARPEAIENGTLERIELQQVVLDAVRRLKEPYRTTIVARFLRG